MKKRICLVLTLVLAFYLLPGSIKAFTGSVSLDCQTNVVKPGDTITCDLKGNASDNITSVSIPFTTTGATILNFKSTDLWAMPDVISNGQIDQSVKADYKDKVIGNFVVGTFTIKINDDASGNATLALNNVVFNDAQFNGNSISSISKSFEIKQASSVDSSQVTNQSNNQINDDDIDKDIDDEKLDGDTDVSTTGTDTISHAYLKDLQIQNYDIVFNENEFDYNLKIKNEKVLIITPVMKYSDAFYNISGNQDLNDGSLITVKVTDKNNNTNEYFIHIIKNSEINVGQSILIVICILLVFINIWRILKKKR